MKRSRYPVSSDNHRVDVVSAEIHLLQLWGSFRDPGIAKGFPEPVCGASVTLLWHIVYFWTVQTIKRLECERPFSLILLIAGPKKSQESFALFPLITALHHMCSNHDCHFVHAFTFTFKPYTLGAHV